MIPQKRHAGPQGSAFVDWLRIPARGWWQRWTSADERGLYEDTSGTVPASASPPLPVDIDLTLLESLPSIHWMVEAVPVDAPRKDFSDTWRTRPNVRFVGNTAADAAAEPRTTPEGDAPLR